MNCLKDQTKKGIMHTKHIQPDRKRNTGTDQSCIMNCLKDQTTKGSYVPNTFITCTVQIVNKFRERERENIHQSNIKRMYTVLYTVQE